GRRRLVGTKFRNRAQLDAAVAAIHAILGAPALAVPAGAARTQARPEAGEVVIPCDVTELARRQLGGRNRFGGELHARVLLGGKHRGSERLLPRARFMLREENKMSRKSAKNKRYRASRSRPAGCPLLVGWKLDAE